ncbi:MAG: 30S ribosomal protein S3 [Alphaproteobacteria bacterium]|nr:MAG: 30S ribosomal protein S3 [Alphaproteobacteria bacterium]
MGNKVPLFNLWGGKYKSDWYANYKDYSKYVIEDAKIRSLLQAMNKVHGWGMSEVHVTRIANNIQLDIEASRPGVIIGKAGQDLEWLKARVSSILGPNINLKIQVNPIRKPEIDAQCLADKIAFDLCKGKRYKFLIKKYIGDAMRSGIKGIKVECSGRLGGVEIARQFKISEGSVPRQTIRADIDYALSASKTNSGLCGVKVWINKGVRK